MMAMRAAIVVTLAWTRLYTWRLDSDIADERRAEIESDLWEMSNDHDAQRGWQQAMRVLGRLVDGVADDVAWRMDQAERDEQLLVRRTLAVVMAGALIVGLWTIPAVYAGGMRQVSACAAQVPAPEGPADLRLELMRCAGAFFMARK